MPAAKRRVVFHVEGLGQNYRMQKNGGLGYGGFLQLFLRAFEHDVRYIEIQYFIREIEALARHFAALKKLFSHAGELRTLPGKHYRRFFHLSMLD